MPPSAGVARRTPDQVRSLLLEAARDLFAAKGYAGASTRDIAVRAGVSEALLFRHFGNKANLFAKAVLDPLNEFVHDYVEQWRARPPADHTPESVTRAFIEGLYALATEHRELLMALVVAQAYESLGAVNGVSPLSSLLSELETLAKQEASGRGYEFDVPVTTRLITGQILSVVLLDDWLFGPGRRPSKKRILDEMTALFLHGLAHRGSDQTFS